MSKVAEFEAEPPKKRKKHIKGGGEKSRRRLDRGGRPCRDDGGRTIAPAAKQWGEEAYRAGRAKGEDPDMAATGIPSGVDAYEKSMQKHRTEDADYDYKGRASGGRTPNFHPGGEKGKLHREMGIPEDQKIPTGRLEEAAHSKNPEIRRDAIRAQTMKKWHHTGPKS